MPATIEQIEESDGGNAWFEVTLYEGRNQQVRKMFDAVGHSVVKLRRVRIGSLTDEGIKPGKHRMLEPEEIKIFIKRAVSYRDKPDAAKSPSKSPHIGKVRRKTR